MDRQRLFNDNRRPWREAAVADFTVGPGDESSLGAQKKAGRSLAAISADNPPRPVLRSRLVTAPELLREELERQRAHGRSFAVAWPIALNVALDGQGMYREFWASTFSQQRGIWAANYWTDPGRSGGLGSTNRRSAAGLVVDDEREGRATTGR